MPTRRILLAAGLTGACTTAGPPAPPLSSDTVIVSAESWHTDLCLTRAALAEGPLAPLRRAVPEAAGFAFGFGLESWMRAERPGSAEALSALSGGPAVVSVRALDAAVPRGSEEAVSLRVPAGGLDAIAHFVADQLLDPLAAGPVGTWMLLRSRLRYGIDFTCNSWVVRALLLAGLPLPAAGLRFRGETMAALRREARRQG